MMNFGAPLPPGKAIVQKAMALIGKATSRNDILRAHAFLVKTSFDHNIFVLAKFLRRCVECASHQAILHGRALFDQILFPDTFIWNTLIRAYLLARIPGMREIGEAHNGL